MDILRRRILRIAESGDLTASMKNEEIGILGHLDSSQGGRDRISERRGRKIDVRYCEQNNEFVLDTN